MQKRLFNRTIRSARREQPPEFANVIREHPSKIKRRRPARSDARLPIDGEGIPRAVSRDDAAPTPRNMVDIGPALSYLSGR